jgi:methyltransferase-like protein
MALGGMLQVLSEPAPCASTASEKPKAWLIARGDAEAGATLTTSMRHEVVGIDPSAMVVLPILDGTANLKAIETKLVEAAKAGQLNYSRDGQPITDSKELKATISEHVPSLLSGLAATGLLES